MTTQPKPDTRPVFSNAAGWPSQTFSTTSYARHWAWTGATQVVDNYQIVGSVTSGFTLKHVDPLEHFTRTLERLNEALAAL